MNKKQIQELSNYLVKKTYGQFHYEEEYWKSFFSKNEVKKIQKQLNICMKDKNYQYFCNCLFDAFDNVKLDWKNITPKNLEAVQSNPTFKIMNEYTK
tara:strand:- start:376 stop:666 length:291 start_codon:yes stop_codon:yes gene_type:complete